MIDRTNRTILMLCDAIPETDAEELNFIRSVCRDADYVVREISVQEFCSTEKMTALCSFMMIVPNARNLPVETREALSRYSRANGSVLFLGGPLYYNWIERDKNGNFVKRKLEDTIDAGFAMESPYVREGVAPSYKTYDTKGIVRAVAASGQSIFRGELELPEAVDVTIPCETFRGVGFNTEAVCRFLPLVDCFGEEEVDPVLRGRCNGRRGALAFLELENTLSDGYEGRAVYGMVESTAVGSAVAQIGLRCGLHRVKGADSLLRAIMERFRMGLYLYEGGANGIRFRAGEEMKVGARILNTTFRFQRVGCRILVETAGEPIVFETSQLLSPKSITPVEFAVPYAELEKAGIEVDRESRICVELFWDDEKIDSIESFYSFENPKPVEDPNEFVAVDGDRFVLNGKPWYMAGMNYWSTYSPAREKRYYWMGMFDKSNYDAQNVEEDLAYMETLGINCVLIRVDLSGPARVVHAVRDFLIRCKRHGIRVMFAYTQATASKFYCAEAVEEFFKNVFVAKNPTVMAFDIEWESCPDHYGNVPAREEFYDEWEAWLIQKYGSVGAAENALRVVFPQDIYGNVEYAAEDTPESAAEVRAFADDCMNRYWARMSEHFRPLTPNQLMTFRLGGAVPPGRSQAAKFVDFRPLEIYVNVDYEKTRGNLVAKCSMAVQIEKYETGGKPVVWAEYGRSVCGMKWHNILLYDHENQCYYDSEVKIQEDFNQLMQQVVDEADCAGSAPWWWCGGFRYTEMADCGFVMPDGRPNASCLNYSKFCKRMKEKLAAGIRDTREAVVYEGNVDEFIGGKPELVEEKCLSEYYKAKEQGKRLEIRTRYRGE